MTPSTSIAVVFALFTLVVTTARLAARRKVTLLEEDGLVAAQADLDGRLLDGEEMVEIGFGYGFDEFWKAPKGLKIDVRIRRVEGGLFVSPSLVTTKQKEVATRLSWRG